MNNHRLLTGLLAAILLSGGTCAIGQTRKIYTIENLFEIAEANSAQLRPLYSAEEEARREISIARSGRLPDINTDLSLSYIGDGFTTKRNFSDYQRAPIPHFGNTFGINVTQPVYTGGAISAGIELAGLKLTASRYATELQRDNIRYRIVGFYLDIYKFVNLRTVLETNITHARKVLDKMNARYAQGVALQNDITRYELLVSNLELQLVKINNTLTILNRNLAETAGLDENTEVIPDSMILARSLPVAGEEWWQQSAESESPSLKLARTGVDINRKAETLAKSARFPEIGIQAGWNIEGPILVEVPPLNRNLSYWYAGISMSYKLSSLYKNNKSLSKSRAATQTALDKLEAARENVSLEISADYVRYMEAYEELKNQQKSVELADRNYQTISTRYFEGMALITDMLDASNSKLDAEQKLVNARINIINCYYRLLFTSGKI